MKLNEILFESILDFLLQLALTAFANCPYNKSQANITYTPHVGKQNIMLHVHKCHAHATNTHTHTQGSTQMRRLWFLVKGNEAATILPILTDAAALFPPAATPTLCVCVCVANIENCSAQCEFVCVLIPAAAAGKRAMDL